MTDPAPIADDELEVLFSSLRDTPLALAVSGGPDSMALMWLAARWRALFATNADIIVLTVDHGLRTASADEARFVAQQAGALRFPHHLLRWEGDKPETGLPSAARGARYDLMMRCIAREAQERGVRRVLLTAHTSDDQAETFVMRLARGSGLEGLSGIAPDSVRGFDAGVGGDAMSPLRIVRPLLGVSKARLIATLDRAEVAYVEDPTNDDVAYERARVRRVMALLGEAGVEPAQVARSADRLRGAAGLVASLMHDWMARNVSYNAGAFGSLDAAVFEREPEIGMRALRQLIGTFGGEAAPAELSQVEAAAAAIRAGLSDPSVFSGATLGGTIVALAPRRDAGPEVRVFREPGRGLPVTEAASAGPVIWDRRFAVSAADGWPRRGGWRVAALGQAGWQHLRASHDCLAHSRLPYRAARTLPAIYRDGEIVAVPYFSREVPALGRHFEARFVGPVNGLGG